MKRSIPGISLVLFVSALLSACGRGSASLDSRSIPSTDPANGGYTDFFGAGSGNGPSQGGASPGGMTPANLALTPQDQSLLADEVGPQDAHQLMNLVPQMDSPSVDPQVQSQIPSRILGILARVQDPQVQAAFYQLAQSIAQDMHSVSPSSPPSQWRAKLQQIKAKVIQFIKSAIARLKQKKAAGK